MRQAIGAGLAQPQPHKHQKSRWRGAKEALPPRPTERGLQGGRAARLRRSRRDPLARSPVTPARIPPPAPPVSPTGRGHGEALIPPETGKLKMTKQANRKPGATAAASANAPPGSRTASWPTWSRVSARGVKP